MFGQCSVVGVGRVFFRMLLVGSLIVGGLAVGFHPGRRIQRGGDKWFYRRRNGCIGLKFRRLCRARGRMVMLIMCVGVLVVSMFMLMIMMFRAAVVMSGVVVQIFGVQVFRVQAFGVQAFGVRVFCVLVAFLRPGGGG